MTTDPVTQPKRIHRAAAPAALPMREQPQPSSGRDGGSGHDSDWYSVHRGAGPVLATAIHGGSGLGAEAAALMRLGSADRVREEDPYTDEMIASVPTRVFVHRSRFEVDLNRVRAESVYRSPQEAWGLEVWREPPPDAFVTRSRRLHDHFYQMMADLLQGLVDDHGTFVLLDVHSYNHRRGGPNAAPAPPAKAPDINIGTFSMPKDRWSQVLEALEDTIAAFDHEGRRLAVGRNVAFEGRGALTGFVHQTFPQTGCAIAFEVKKFFMDEWTGVPFRHEIASLQRLFAALVPALAAALER